MSQQSAVLRSILQFFCALLIFLNFDTESLSAPKITTQSSTKKNSALPAIPAKQVAPSISLAPMQAVVLPAAHYLVTPATRIRVAGMNGDVRVNFQEGSGPLIVKVYRDKQEVLGISRVDNNFVQVIMPNQSNREEWVKIIASNMAQPSYQIEIKGPPVPIEVIWRDGAIRIQGASKGAIVSSWKGLVDLNGFEGDSRIQINEGSISATNGKGKLTISAHNSQLTLKNIEGVLNIYNHLGRSQLSEIKGETRWSTFRGHFIADGIKGAVEVKSGSGSLSVKGLDGDLRGQNDNGDTYVQMMPKGTVRLESIKGDFRIRLPSNSGAKVSLLTEEGRLVAPNTLQISAEPKSKSATGRLKGSEAGNISLKSKSGNIVVLTE